MRPFDEPAGLLLDELLAAYRIKGRHNPSCVLSLALRRAAVHGWLCTGCEQMRCACLEPGSTAAHAGTSEVERLRAELAERNARVLELEGLLNTPHIADFLRAVKLEALHQRDRWGSQHDAGKEPADWFWLLGYLGGKALTSAIKGDRDRALHHTISSAAVLLNWHASLSGDSTAMRPGIETPAGEPSS